MAPNVVYLAEIDGGSRAPGGGIYERDGVIGGQMNFRLWERERDIKKYIKKDWVRKRSFYKGAEFMRFFEILRYS